MLKSFIYSLILFFTAKVVVFSAVPPVNCGSLPGCSDWGFSETETFWVIWTTISTGIQYVAVIAVLAVMLGGIMYLLSSGQEEKTKKAKNIIIWALVWVFISVSAYGIINIVNNFRI